jgi:hypothetical protein
MDSNAVPTTQQTSWMTTKLHSCAQFCNIFKSAIHSTAFDLQIHTQLRTHWAQSPFPILDIRKTQLCNRRNHLISFYVTCIYYRTNTGVASGLPCIAAALFNAQIMQCWLNYTSCTATTTATGTASSCIGITSDLNVSYLWHTFSSNTVTYFYIKIV